MKDLLLFDDPSIRGDLLPFTFTRPVADLRVGILKIFEKWEKISEGEVSFLTQDYLQEKFPRSQGSKMAVNGALLPSTSLLERIEQLKPQQALCFGKTLLAVQVEDQEQPMAALLDREVVQLDFEPLLVQKPWEIFQFNGQQIREDFDLLTRGRDSEPLDDPHTKVYGSMDAIFIEAGARIQAAVLNATTGPIYIGKNAEIQEGSLIRGPFALGEGSTVNMGAKLRGDTTIGPFSKVGGEISNSVIFGYSNKGHEGFLGNSVIGEWCNLGADTNTSNLKNNYAPVKLWNYVRGSFVTTGLQFCGLMMGDHAKCGINTMWNTGTVVGVGANVFGDGFPRNFVPSFAWGGAAGFSTFQFPKFSQTAAAVMGRRSEKWTPSEEEMLRKVFDLTRNYRIWEK